MIFNRDSIIFYVILFILCIYDLEIKEIFKSVEVVVCLGKDAVDCFGWG